MGLFRTEALEHKKVKLHGRILVVQPLSIKVLTLLSVIVTGLYIAYIILGEYTQKQRVIGVLIPDKGLIRVMPMQVATVLKLHVKEGDRVTQGQVLYTLSNELNIGNGEGAQTKIRSGLLIQKESFHDEENRLNELYESSYEKNQHQLNTLLIEKTQIVRHKAIVSEQIQLLKKNLERYLKIAESGFVSEIQVDQQKRELLAQESILIQITREETALSRDIEALEESLRTSDLRRKNDLASVQRNMLSTQNSLLENDLRREIVVTAPVSGTVAAIVAKPGQLVGKGSLLSILPEGATLRAELYATSQSISFIKNGDGVRLRYVAYPYQKFGQHQGTVADVSRVALPASEITSMNLTSFGNTQFYRITVELPSQTILAYGNHESLQTGMEVEADILLDTRKLYEWIFEPLYSVYGKA